MFCRDGMQQWNQNGSDIVNIFLNTVSGTDRNTVLYCTSYTHDVIRSMMFAALIMQVSYRFTTIFVILVGKWTL